ncbi:MAG: PilT/PilU family type 4a pilus ATPase [Proteobacteria bacterium]|nr:PilT/PilU family type 4a pilus ATPase [Pseudomonadota bacterium]
MDLKPYFQKMIENEASDLYLTAGMPACVRVNGEILALSNQILAEEVVCEAILSLMTKAQQDEYVSTKECNFALDIDNIGRFRVSAFVQRNHKGCVIRYIKSQIPSIEELKLPSITKTLAMIKKGLILAVGATGMGKTTTISSMINLHNQLTTGHILTIEDPVEYIHKHNKCIVTQREVGIDTDSFAVALKNALRQSPDVILIGEIRDAKTMRYALTFAETGHLCLATLHANDTVQAIERVVHFFPEVVRDKVWLDLSLNLKAIIGQRLIRHKDGNSRVPAVEVMLNTPIIAECIRKGQVQGIREYITRDDGSGMQSMDQSLYQLYEFGLIKDVEALQHAESANNMRILMKLKNASPASKTKLNKTSLPNKDDENRH